MKAVLQRVKEASVEVDGKIVSSINNGLLVLLGISTEDSFNEDVKLMASKIVNQRIFNDEEGKMNLSVKQIKGEILLVSQFTLMANTKKGNRPSYINAAKPDVAIPIYEAVIEEIENLLEKQIGVGVFGADMKVSLVNDGPVTIIVDTKGK